MASLPPEARRASWLKRAQTVWRATDKSEVGVVLILLALCVLVRLLRLQPIEYYHDEVSRWHFVRQWFYENDFSHAEWTHHMARFGVNVPLYFVQLLFGRGALSYYVWPVASFALQVLLVYLYTKRLGGRAAGVVAALFLSIFTGMDRGASQLLPDAFTATAMVLSCYLLVRYQDASEERRWRWLIGAGLAFVWAYLIKESNLLLLPGTAAAVWLCRGRFREGVFFCAVVLLAILLETAGFRLFTDYSSRFAIVGESHGHVPSMRFLQLFERFTRLEPAWQMLVWLWVPSAAWLAASSDRRLRVLVLVPAAFLFLLTFMVRSLNPLTVWTRFFSRYFEPVAPLLIAAIALFAVEVGRRAWLSYAPPRLHALPARLSRWALPLVVMICCLVGLAEYAASRAYFPDHPLREAPRIASIVNDAYRRNLPIVQVRPKANEHEERKVRPLKVTYGIYLEDRLLAESDLAKNGWLPDILDAVRYGKRHTYLLRDARIYGKGQIEEWIERGCAVVLTEKKGLPGTAQGVPSLVMSKGKLPAKCRPPT